MSPSNYTQNPIVRQALGVIVLAAAVAPLGAWVARNAIVLGVPGLSTQTQEVIWQGNNA